MSGTSRQTVQIKIVSELGYEKIPIAAVAVISDQQGFPEERVDNLKMVMGEAVTNAIEHGNQLIPDAIVTIKISAEAGKLTIIVIDEGHQPIPPLPHERKDRKDNRGWGLLLIRDLADEAEVNATPEGNIVKMMVYHNSTH